MNLYKTIVVGNQNILFVISSFTLTSGHNRPFLNSLYNSFVSNKNHVR